MSIHLSTSEDNELAKRAYAAVAAIQTVAPNDKNRLGYHVWLFLRGEIATLDEAVAQSLTRFLPRERTNSSAAQEIERALLLNNA